MTLTPGGPVVVVGGGTGFVGRAVVGVLLAGGARVIVPARREADAERFYLEASPETVPRLRTAVGEFGDPGMPGRIAAVARREFGGVDHLVSVIGSASPGPLATLDAQGVQRVIEDDVAAPGRFILGMLRHLNGAAPVKRVVAVTPAAEHKTGGEPDAWSLGRTFVEGLVTLLGDARRPGLEFYVLRAPRLARGGRGVGLVGQEVARLLAEGGALGADDFVIQLIFPSNMS